MATTVKQKLEIIVASNQSITCVRVLSSRGVKAICIYMSTYAWLFYEEKNIQFLSIRLGEPEYVFVCVRMIDC